MRLRLPWAPLRICYPIPSFFAFMHLDPTSNGQILEAQVICAVAYESSF